MTKSIIAAATVAVTALLGTSPRAQGGLELSIGFVQIYVSDHAPCGCPIYTRRTCRGYDRYHRPLFTYQRQPFHCGCKGHSKRYKDHEKERKKYFKEREKHYKKASKGKRK